MTSEGLPTGKGISMAAVEPERPARGSDSRRRSTGSQPTGSPRSNSPRTKSQPAMSMRDVVQAARDEIAELVGRPAEAVSAVERTEDGWVVTVEVVELERVPPTTSVLASYEVEFDHSGEVESFNRLRRYYRNQAGEL